LVPAEFRASGIEDYGEGHSNWKEILDAWNDDEIALDPTRITLMCGSAGFDGTEFKGILADKYDIQLNKTTRNSILLQTNINNTRSDVAHLIKVLADISRQIETDLARGNDMERNLFAERVQSLVEDVPDLPNFSAFHDVFRDDPKSKTSEGHMREAFYAAYKEDNCEYVKVNSPEMDERLKNGPILVAADFVIPYPPGFPIMVPGQIITEETITFMRKLDVKEIHGYHAAQGLRLLKVSSFKK
jgi:arginine decarboxylase